MFNEDVYQHMKNVTKFKFLHIGLSLWESVLNKCGVWDSKKKQSEEILDIMLTPNFLKVLIKNVQNQKT